MSAKGESMKLQLAATISIWALFSSPATADPIANEIQTLSQSDPNALTLMFVAIGLLVMCAGTLIGVTTYYLVKGKRAGK